MKPEVKRHIETLEHMDLADLRDEYYLLFKEVPYNTNRRFLRRRIAWRIQFLTENAQLPPEMQSRIDALANLADMRVTEPMPKGLPIHKGGPSRDLRLPPPGTIIEKKYHQETYRVTVLEQGFQWDGKSYRSLSAIAQDITGSKWNGYKFFGLTRKGGGK